MKKNISPQAMSVFPLMIIIPTIAMFSYIGMALNIGIIYQDQAQIYSLRYVDWFFTTPILLYILSVIALKKSKKTANLVTTIIILDLIMIITGIWAGLMDTGLRILLFSISSLAFIAILIIILNTFGKEVREKHDEVQKYYNRLSRLLLITWTIYPVVWTISSHGFWPYIDLDTEILLYLILDVFAKGLFGYFLLSDGDALTEAISTKLSNSSNS